MDFCAEWKEEVGFIGGRGVGDVAPSPRRTLFDAKSKQKSNDVRRGSRADAGVRWALGGVGGVGGVKGS